MAGRIGRAGAVRRCRFRPSSTRRLRRQRCPPPERAARASRGRADGCSPAIEEDLAELTGLDRYETITWRLAKNEAGESGLVVRRRAKSYAPPFMMLGLNLENTTSSAFRITATARYLAFGVLDLGLGAAHRRHAGRIRRSAASSTGRSARTPFFIAPYAGVTTSTFNVIDDDQLVAHVRSGVQPRRAPTSASTSAARSDLRVGAFIGRLDADVRSAIRDCRRSRAEQAAEAVWRSTARTARSCPRAAAWPRCGCLTCSTPPT